MVLAVSPSIFRPSRLLYTGCLAMLLLTQLPACSTGDGHNTQDATTGGDNTGTGANNDDTGNNISSPDQQLYADAATLYSQKLYDSSEVLLDQILLEYATGFMVDDAHYLKGKIAYRRDDFVTAKAEFAIVITQYPSSDLVDNAIYWTGKTEHAQGHYDAARSQYQMVLSNYPDSDYLESSRYELAKSYFDEGGTTPPDAGKINLAIAGFRDILINHGTSIKADDAQYFLARSFHELNDYASARGEYQIMWDTYPDSTWRDNAQYQIGRTYYHEADVLASATPSATAAEVNNKLASAISAFELLLSSYPGSGSADTAQYYLGRSYQQLQPPDFLQARDHFSIMIANYATSVFVDNAQLQLGRSYYSDAIANNDATLFTTALTELNKVLTHYPGSNSADNAQLYIGKSYHKRGIANLDAADLVNARSAYLQLLADYPASTLRDNAALRIGETYHDAGNNNLGTDNCTQEKIQMQWVIDNFPGSTSAAGAQTHLDGAAAVDADHGFCP